MNAENIIGYIVLSAFFCGIVGAFIGSNWNNAGKGFACGLFMGPIGWIVITQLPASADQKTEIIPESLNAVKGCPHCGAKYDFSNMAPGVYTCGECKETFKLEINAVAAAKESRKTSAQICPRCKSKFELANSVPGDCRCPVCTHIFKSAKAA